MKSLAKTFSYMALELATGGRGVRRVIGDETFRFRARWSRYYSGDYEPATFDFLREWCRPGDTVLDIGAHIGLFTVLMSHLVGPTGRVYSFEPTPHTCEELRETIRLNFCESNVEVWQKAVSRRTGRASFFDTGDAVSNANSLVRGRRCLDEISVETVSIDESVGHGVTVGLMKIDVEGAELDVLRGASRIFASSRPAVQLGLHPLQIRHSGGSLEKIWDLLQDYRMTIFSNRKTVDRTWFCDHDELFDIQALPSN